MGASDQGSDFPSPKVRPSDRSGADGWLHFHAAYSRSFAKAALQLLTDTDRSGPVLDPFCGSGTTARAAADTGLASVSCDMNPALLAVARASVLPYEAAEKVLESLKSAPPLENGAQVIGGIEEDWILPETAAELTHLRHHLSKLRNGRARTFASGVFVAAARDIIRPAVGSNPTWPKPPLRREKQDVRALLIAKATSMAADLENYECQPRTHAHAFINSDARKVPLTDGSACAILTSPPYLSRIDYVRATLPELLALGCGEADRLRQLREQVMGGVIAGDSSPAARTWLPKTQGVLDAIWAHSSKASRSYYTTLARRYFGDLSETISECARVLKPGARGIVVVQTSYYKDVLIPLPAIVSEMAESHGLSAKHLHNVRVSQHFGHLSPQQRAYVANKTLDETAVLLVK